MVGGRHPSESGTFTAGFEPICNDCAVLEEHDPTAPPRAPMTPTQLDALIPEQQKTPAHLPGRPASSARNPVSSEPHVHGHQHSHRRRSGRFSRRAGGSNPALFVVIGIGVALAVVLMIVLASKH